VVPVSRQPDPSLLAPCVDPELMADPDNASDNDVAAERIRVAEAYVACKQRQAGLAAFVRAGSRTQLQRVPVRSTTGSAVEIVMAVDRTPLAPEKEYQRQNPGAGGPPQQQQERVSKRNRKTTRDDGGAAIAGSQNEDVKGPKPNRGPRGAST
jgi:hypothetical protein